MNKLIKSLTTLTVGAFVFASAALAIPNPDRASLDNETWQPPQPTEIVSPSFARGHEGSTIRVKLTIDELGNPEDIIVLFAQDEALKRDVVKAVEQWKFKPAQQDGKAVKSRVVMPIELKVDYNS
ncbi:MAG: hypothetical protein SynsKO_24380 [Synoicihabitans sp.]